MNTYTAVVMPGLIEPSGLLVENREAPVPTAGQAVVRVEATGVSFAEQQMRRGKYYDQPHLPVRPRLRLRRHRRGDRRTAWTRHWWAVASPQWSRRGAGRRRPSSTPHG